MPVFKGFGVWIKSGRLRKAREYGVRENRNESKVSCYVPCEDDDYFAVLIRVPPSCSTFLVILYLDGVEVSRRFVDDKKAHQNLTLTGAYVDSSTVRAFRFVSVRDIHVNNGVGPGFPAMYPEEEVGSVRVSILRYTSVFGAEMLSDASGERTVPASFANGDAIVADTKTMSTVTHIARLSEEIEMEKGDDVWEIDGEHSHFATFVFMYRMLDVIRAQDIIPALNNTRSRRKSGAVRRLEIGPLFMDLSDESEREGNDGVGAGGHAPRLGADNNEDAIRELEMWQSEICRRREALRKEECKIGRQEARVRRALVGMMSCAEQSTVKTEPAQVALIGSVSDLGAVIDLTSDD